MKTETPQRPLPDGRGVRIAIVASRFHGEVVDRLLAGAEELLRQAGVTESDLRVERVPGAWELPHAAELLAAAGRWDALVALGTLIRGETLHFDLIAQECARGLAEASRRSGVPIAFGVLTCDTMEQARARAGGPIGNQGAEAALAALEMVELARRLKG